MSAKAKAKANTLRVRQVKSGIGYGADQKATLKALGLGKMGRSRELPDNSYVLVGDLPPDHLADVLQTLPRPGDRSIFVKLWRRLFG